MTESSEKTCQLCKIQIEKNSGITTLSCGHVFHARCAHGPLSRNYAYCPTCVPPESSDVIPTKEDTAFNPIDLGDDINVETLLQQRLILIKKRDEFSLMGGESLSISSVRDCLSMREKEICNEVHGSTVDELSYDEKSNWFRTISDMASMVIQSGVDHGTNEPSGVDDVYECMENELESIIARRTPSHILVTKHGVDAHVLIRKEYNLTVLFGLGYTLHDMILFGATWTDLRGLGMSSTVWKAHKEMLPVKMLIQVWKIKISDVYNDVCDRRFDNLASIGFGYDEYAALGVTSIEILISMGLIRSHMKDLGFSMQEWKGLGLTGAHMTKLNLDEPYLRERLQWTNSEDKVVLFKATFGMDPPVAIKRAEAPKKTHRQKHM